MNAWRVSLRTIVLEAPHRVDELFAAVSCAVTPSNYPFFVLLGSESSTIEIHISSELRDYEDVDADGESLENSLRD